MATISDDVVNDIVNDTLDEPLLIRYLRDRLDINKPDSNGLPPLCAAAKHGKLNSVQVLLNHKANPNVLDSTNRSALSYAKALSNDLRTPVERELLAAGATGDSKFPIPTPQTTQKFPGHVRRPPSPGIDDPPPPYDDNDRYPVPGSSSAHSGGASGSGSNSSPRIVTFFHPPGNVKDLEQGTSGRKSWSMVVNQVIENIIQRKQDAGKAIQFYNPASGANTTEEIIKWPAFPKKFEGKSDKFKLADIRDNQDEYCEWEVTRNSDGELVSVTFTTEVPEYYNHLSTLRTGGKAKRLVDLYNQPPIGDGSDKVKEEDLFDGDKYNNKNPWNYRGPKSEPVHAGRIAHMIRENNTLAEAADLVADASVVVPDVTDPIELLKLLDVSADSPKRSSDPMIVDHINGWAREGKYIAVKNPVGLYIHSFESDKIKAPDGKKKIDIETLWKAERGSEDGKYCVRATFEIPPDLVGKLKDRDTGRKIEYGSQIAQYVWVAVYVTVTDKENIIRNIQPIATFIEGRHIKPTGLSLETISSQLLPEYFGDYLAKTEESKRATTLSSLLRVLPEYTWIAYAADEGIGIKFDKPRENVRVRLVIVCTPYDPIPRRDNSKSKMAQVSREFMQKVFTVPTLAIVAVGPSNDPNNIDSERGILECASFSPELGWFNFYKRELNFPNTLTKGRWLYFGSSTDAFAPDTQGLGPFCGHANGGMIMKEADDPWPHWHSPRARLVLPETHLMYKNPLFRDTDQSGSVWYFGLADELVKMLEKGTQAWFEKRYLLDLGPLDNPFHIGQRVHQWIAHVLMTTSMTISCSRGTGKSDFKIPRGFFFNSRALSLVVEKVGTYEDEINEVAWEKYENALRELKLATIGKFHQNDVNDIVGEHEGQAPWKVITPSSDDALGIEHVLRSGLLPKKVVTAMLMVDFCNPVFSWRRAKLMRYIPSTASLDSEDSSPDDKYGLGAGFIHALKNALIEFELDDDSPEAEFLKLVEDPGLVDTAAIKLYQYIDGINLRLRSQGGVLEYMKVAETKRRMFRPPPKMGRPMHPLAEFDMSLPYAHASRMTYGETWFMNPDGTAKKIPPPETIWHPRNIQAHFSSAGCPFSASS